MSRIIKMFKNIDAYTEIDDILRNIDKYTKSDDILREIAISSALTNRLLLALIENKGGAGVIPEAERKRILAIAKRYETGDYETIINNWDSVTLSKDKMLIDKFGSGVVVEIIILSASGIVGNDDYSVNVIADGNAVYNDSYTNFAVISDYAQDVSAFDDGTFFVTNFNTIYYSKRIQIKLLLSSDIIFTKVFIKRIQKK